MTLAGTPEARRTSIAKFEHLRGATRQDPPFSLTMTDQKHFLMTGGGTLGSVTPLLAIAAELRKRDAHTVVSWVGTPNGPERLVVERYRIAFYSLSSPKLNRYKKWLWPLLPFGLAVSVVRAFSLLRTLRPAMVFTAGSFVSVPVVLAAWVLRIPVWVHQLDVQPGVANKIMAYFAKRISVTFDENRGCIPKQENACRRWHVSSRVASGRQANGSHAVRIRRDVTDGACDGWRDGRGAD